MIIIGTHTDISLDISQSLLSRKLSSFQSKNVNGIRKAVIIHKTRLNATSERNSCLLLADVALSPSNHRQHHGHYRSQYLHHHQVSSCRGYGRYIHEKLVFIDLLRVKEIMKLWPKLSLSSPITNQAWRLLSLFMGLLTVGGEEEEQLHVLLLKVGKK